MNTTEPVQATAATTQATTQTATEAAIQAVEAAQSEWTGCHDDEEATPEWVAQSEDAAASAAGCGDVAIAALRRGDYRAALVAAMEAASTEREYGAAPTWGPVVEAVAGAWLRAEPAITAALLTEEREYAICAVLAKAAKELAADGEAVPTPCECHKALGVKCGRWVAPTDRTTVEWMPHDLRSSHSAAGNWGTWPHNGAWRLEVSDGCAAEVEADNDDTDGATE